MQEARPNLLVVPIPLRFFHDCGVVHCKLVFRDFGKWESKNRHYCGNVFVCCSVVLVELEMGALALSEVRSTVFLQISFWQRTEDEVRSLRFREMGRSFSGEEA